MSYRATLQILNVGRGLSEPGFGEIMEIKRIFLFIDFSLSLKPPSEMTALRTKVEYPFESFFCHSERSEESELSE
jgi:hypothetical protein